MSLSNTSDSNVRDSASGEVVVFFQWGGNDYGCSSKNRLNLDIEALELWQNHITTLKKHIYVKCEQYVFSC